MEKRNDSKRISKFDSLKNTLTPFGIASFFILFVYAMSLLIPFCWAITTSFRSAMSYSPYMDGEFAWPNPWIIDNYKDVWTYFAVKIPSGATFRFVAIPEMALNSVLYALGSAFVSMATALLVAYVAARFDFKFCGVIYFIVIIQMIIPIVGSLPSELRMARALGLYDSILGMYVMRCYVNGMYFLVFYGSFKLIPKDYAEAAQIDGAGNWTVMFRIVIPFVKGSIFTVILLNFISCWNDYQVPLMYMPSHPTLAYGLFMYTGGNFDASTADTPHQLAGCVAMAVPLLILFLTFQKRLLGDLTVGGLK